MLIHRDTFDEMLKHLADSAFPYFSETGGILIGTGGKTPCVHAVVPQPEKGFSTGVSLCSLLEKTKELIKDFNKKNKSNLRILGRYHSHPEGPGRFSFYHKPTEEDDRFTTGDETSHIPEHPGSDTFGIVVSFAPDEPEIGAQSIHSDRLSKGTLKKIKALHEWSNKPGTEFDEWWNEAQEFDNKFYENVAEISKRLDQGKHIEDALKEVIGKTPPPFPEIPDNISLTEKEQGEILRNSFLRKIKIVSGRDQKMKGLISKLMDEREELLSNFHR